MNKKMKVFNSACVCSVSEVQCVLLGDLLVLLQKQDDKMVLKCQSKSTIAVQEGKQMLSPIIKLDSVFLREVATGQPHTAKAKKTGCFPPQVCVELSG